LTHTIYGQLIIFADCGITKTTQVYPGNNIVVWWW